MGWRIFLAVICGVSAAGAIGAWAQEAQLATFQEIAQIIVDPATPDSVTSSVTLQSTSNQEIKVPSELEGGILENGMIIAVIVTNEEGCVLGVSGESCILINVRRSDDWEGIGETQDETRRVGDMFIGEINGFLDTDAQYHSVFLHHRDEANVALGTSGAVSGRNTVSAVYTMPMEATDSMYEKMSALLLPRQIRESGGFYDVARDLSSEEAAKVTFSMIQQRAGMLYQLKVSAVHDGTGPAIRPLEILGTEEMSRSEYFSGGFYPLNSLIQVVILGSDRVAGTEPAFVDTETRDGIPVPTDLRQSGWMATPDSAGAEELMFLFGDMESVDGGDLSITLASARDDGMRGVDVQIIVAVVIAAGAAGAAVFFLRGYGKGA